ncbi:MAG: hypothetical protein AAB960_00915 [Patescibacteria group bacterium]
MLTVIIICKDPDEFLLRAVKSVEELNPQILIGLSSTYNQPLGVRKKNLISMASYEWVLIIDTDEAVSQHLRNEIKEMIEYRTNTVSGYEIPYENYIFGRRAFYGGEVFSKTRLIRKTVGSITTADVHEEITIRGKVGKLNGVIYHDSYRSLVQVLRKFTKYAWQMAGEKRKAHESVTVKKLFLYGPHMVWARAVKDEGWRDGWRGIVIALCFGYLETLMYWLLLFRNIFAY